MAHFAQLNENNEVIRVLVISNDDILDKEGNESEAIGIAFCQKLFDGEGIFKQCSYNTVYGQNINGGQPFRLNYPGEGYVYREDIDGFVLPQPYPSWILDTNTGKWHAPVPVPTEPTWEELRSRDPEETYVWDEDTTSWVIQVGEIPEIQF